LTFARANVNVKIGGSKNSKKTFPKAAKDLCRRNPFFVDVCARKRQRKS